MKQIVVFLILITGYASNTVFSQVLSEEALKYWYYRDRLKYFVYPGPYKGNSVIMTNRNGCKMDGDEWPPYFSIEYAQTHKLMGYYIGLLATEYKLLMDNGQYSDAAATLHELDLALDALIRMDNCEMDAPWYQSQNSLDGFFIRDDVPPVLSYNMTSWLNEDCEYGSFQDYYEFVEDRGFKGCPYEIHNNAVECNNKYENSQNYFYQNPKYGFDINSYVNDNDPNYWNSNSQYWEYWKNEKFTSNDEIIADYMGLSLVAKLVDDQNVKDKALEIARNYFEFASGPFSSFQMWYPNMEEIPLASGGNSIGFIYGIAKSLQRMDDNFTFINISNTAWFAANTTYNQAVNGLATFNNTANFYNRPLYSILIAISRKSGYYSDKHALVNIGNEANLQVFYLLLWAVLHDKNLNNINLYPFEQLVADLNSAPCGGPYHYLWYEWCDESENCSSGWGTQYKYGSDLFSQDNGGDKIGIFPGVDYMLLYNLACLAFPNGFDYNGQTYRFPYYVNLNDRHDIHAIYPYTYVYSMQGAHMDPLGSTIHPEEIRAISTIESSMIVTTTCDVLYSRPQYANNSYKIDGIGDVTLIAGESIRLTDGFRVDAGAHFLAKIESYSCNGLSYKNMNAPPWSENYRASFYDTLISVPRDQRAPIVYNDDDYSYEDYDEPLWDDYYYQYPDTGSTPDLPLIAFLNPNPCTSRTVLQIVPGSDVFVKIELYDISGQKREELYKGNTGTSAFDLEIDMSTYSQGFYLLRIIGDNAVKTIKLMRE